jgi:5-methylcytosine-specific restriction protein A
MAWEASTRRRRLPPEWDSIRRRILERDGHRCYLCGRSAVQVDHVRTGDDHRPGNLAAICTPCHREKSAREGGQVTAGRSPRPRERHPGLLR